MIFRLLIFAFGMEIQKQEGDQAYYHHSCQKAKKDFDGKSWIRHNFLRLNILEYVKIKRFALKSGMRTILPRYHWRT